MKLLAMMLSVFLISGVAWAQDESVTTLCKTLPEYQLQDGVEFVPGADDVVPADINPLNAATPEAINIPVTYILADRFHMLKLDERIELKPDVSMITVHQDGRVEYNGQDVTSQAYMVCGKSVEIPDGEREIVPAEGEVSAPASTPAQPYKKDIESEPLSNHLIEGSYPKDLETKTQQEGSDE